MNVKHVCFSLLLLYTGATIADSPVLGHELWIRFNAGERSIEIRDTLRLPSGPFASGAGRVLFMDPGWRIRSLVFGDVEVDPAAYVSGGRIDVPDHVEVVGLSYDDAVDPAQWPYVIRLPDDRWYADAPGMRHRFRLHAHVPRGWQVLAQGAPGVAGEDGTRVLVQDDPQQGIYLVAGPWHAYTRDFDDLTAAVMLLEPDDDLAETYLDATPREIGRYQQAIGRYPYRSFTLVENPRQTGWGMPGFTLLGSRVIRLPFIVDTSYPHEILHNWWGNGVFVDRAGGNWSEGLTTYLSDHLSRERRGDDAQYRLDALLAWHDFAASGEDFPLARFRGRHDRATQAVGYGKGMFLFHMLRDEVGDVAFMDALRRFYRDWRFRVASYGDIRRAFEQACGCSLGWFFSQWLERSGAPLLRVAGAEAVDESGRHAVRFTVEQDARPVWRVRLKVRVTGIDGAATDAVVSIGSRRESFELDVDAPAARIDLDPDFDLFRELMPAERPMTFSRVFGSRQVAVVHLEPRLAAAATEIANAHPGWRAAGADDARVGEQQAVVLLGGDAEAARRWLPPGGAAHYRIEADSVRIRDESHPLRGGSSVALVDVHGDGTGQPVMWVAPAGQADVAALLERLSHYGRASYAILEQAHGGSRRSGQWPPQPDAFGRQFVAGVDAAPRPLQPPLF